MNDENANDDGDFVMVRVQMSNGTTIVRREVTSLRTLSLQNGNAVGITAPMLGRFWHLKTLWLESNELSTVPDELCSITSLATLGLHENHLTRLPALIGQLQCLSWLSLRQNRLTELPESIAECTNLKTLYLKDNNLCTLPRRLGQLQLTQFSLTNNTRLDQTCVGSRTLVAALDDLVMANNETEWWCRIGRQQVLLIAGALQSLELPTLVLLSIVDSYDAWQQRVKMFVKWNAICAVRHFRSNDGSRRQI
jgi:hypothetical protein